MIRRLFWLILGAVLGVTGYRRLTMLVRSWSPAARAGQLSGFVSDVREGMALYKERHPRPGGSHTDERTGERTGAGTSSDNGEPTGGGTSSHNGERTGAGTNWPNGTGFHTDDAKDGS